MEKKGLHNMVMKRKKIEKEEDLKMLMSGLCNGEIGYIHEQDRYVMRVGGGNNAIFLILGDHDSCNSYSHNAAQHNYVRRLFDGEEIHMVFGRGD